jgi:hypothetical protein
MRAGRSRRGQPGLDAGGVREHLFQFAFDAREGSVPIIHRFPASTSSASNLSASTPSASREHEPGMAFTSKL